MTQKVYLLVAREMVDDAGEPVEEKDAAVYALGVFSSWEKGRKAMEKDAHANADAMGLKDYHWDVNSYGDEGSFVEGILRRTDGRREIAYSMASTYMDEHHLNEEWEL